MILLTSVQQGNDRIRLGKVYQVCHSGDPWEVGSSLEGGAPVLVVGE